MRQAAFIYDKQVSQHVVRTDHVMRPTRLQFTYELLEAYGAFKFPNSRLVAPRHATAEELVIFHSPKYVEAVRRFSRGEGLEEQGEYNFADDGDNPVYPGMYEAACLAVGGTLVAVDEVRSGRARVAFNVAGGYHHAAPEYASGFCIFNDIAVAVHHLVKQGLRVAYIDIDAHHGDGLQDAFYGSDRVLKISIHETGRYLFPGTGHVEEIGTGPGLGYSVNIPLAPHTTDDTYLWAFDQVVPELIECFKPDLLVTQLGTDTHYKDPLTHLSLTAQGYAEVVKRLAALERPWVAVGGGGYEMSVVPRTWTLAYGVMLGVDWPDEIPHDYWEKYGISLLRDTEGPNIDPAVAAAARRTAEDSVARLKRLVFPFHRF